MPRIAYVPLSYYLLFALFPALLFLTALLGLLPWRLMDLLMAYLGRFLPGDIVEKTFVEIVRGATHQLLSVGIAVAFWTASSGMRAVMAGVNTVDDIEERRPWWLRRLIALGLTLGVSLFTLSALVLLIFGEQLGRAVAGWLGVGALFAVAWNVLRWVVIVGLVAIGVELIYHFAPANRRLWRLLTAGSIFAVTSWLLMSFGLRLYVGRFGNYNATYGSIAGAIVLLLWLYLTGLALLVGAEIDAELGGRPASGGGGQGIREERRPPRPAAPRARPRQAA